MISTLEFAWVSQNEHYRTGRGIVSTPEGAVGFALKRPYELIDPHPIAFAPGFTDGIVGPDRMTNYFAEQGRLSFTLDHARTDSWRFKNDPEGHKASNLQFVDEAVRDVCKTDDLEAVDISAHSEGAANSTRFALENPDKVRSVTIKAAGGLIAGDNVQKITLRAVSSISSHARAIGHFFGHVAQDTKIARSSLSYIMHNPKKAREEAAHIGSADIRHRFEQLRGLGIPSAAVQFAGDELFPLNLVKNSTNNGTIFDRFIIYPHDKHAGHLTPQYHPRKVGAIVLEAIKDMTTDH